VAWMITSQGYTPMRALAMDFRQDVRAANTGDQFMFGPAIMVNPVTEPHATSRSVYLPGTGLPVDEPKWFDFWTGKPELRTGEITASAPLSRIPLYVRPGSIIPLGPDEEWSTQKPADPIELRVYPGADGDFILYEDEGDTYGYEKGSYSTIPLHWDDHAHTLTIGARKGSFPGMLQSRSFNVVLVGENHGVGIAPADHADRVVRYEGREMKVAR